MSKTVVTMWLCVVGMVLGASVTGWGAPMGTAFVYQGSLKDGDSPANGSYDFKFYLYDASVGGSLLDTETENGVVLLNGYFDVELDFGSSPFHGEARWLSIEVKPTGGLTYTPLSPRQELKPTPYSLYAAGMDWGNLDNIPPGFADGVDNVGGGDSDWFISGNDMYSIPSGNVGIGTASPDEKLTLPYNQYLGWEYSSVSSNVAHRIGKSSNGAGPLEFRTYFNPGPTGRIFSFIQENGGPFEHLSILYNGDVGIGTTNPLEKLHVKANSGDGEIRIEGSSTGINSTARVSFYNSTPTRIGYIGDASSGTDDIYVVADADNDIRFVTNPNPGTVQERLTITSTGNVGIGETNPGALLDVTSTSGGAATIGASSTTATGIHGVALGANADAAGNYSVAMGTGANAAGPYATAIGTDITVSGNRSVGIGMGSAATVSDDNVMAVMGGNVGIGTTSPSERLEVNGAIKISTADGPHLIIHDSNGSNDRPGIQFTNNGIHFISGDDGSNEVFSFVSQFSKARTNDVQLRVHGNALDSWGTYLELTHDGTDGKINTDIGNIILEPAGDVGIGTTSLGIAKLDVLTTSAKTYSVHGKNHTNQAYGGLGVDMGDLNIGVYGDGGSSSTYNYGVLGESFGTGEQCVGVFGKAYNSSGIGVRGSAFNVGGGIGVKGYGTTYDFFADGPGTNYGSSSSIRWKSNIEEIGQALDKVTKLRGVYFDWDTRHGGLHDVGMIAEEVGQILPEIVEYEENGMDATGMDYSKLTPLLVEAVKELKKEKDTEITELKDRLSEMESLRKENTELRERLAALESKVAKMSQLQKGGL